MINLRAFSFCEVLQKLGKFANFAIFKGVTVFPPFFWELLLLLLGCCWRIAACCMQAHRFAPEIASALPSCFSPGEAWTPIGGWAWVCPKFRLGRKDTCWSAAGARKLAQGNVRSSQGGTMSAFQGTLGQNDDGRSWKRWGSSAKPRIVPAGKSKFCEVQKHFYLFLALLIARGINSYLILNK
jgi:hypothetical protein